MVTGDVTVPNGATLTIEPGAIVKFGRRLGIIVQAGGQLVAQGTVAEPIQFTSLVDDTAGGDTNRDGSATAPRRVTGAGSISTAVRAASTTR